MHALDGGALVARSVTQHYAVKHSREQVKHRGHQQHGRVRGYPVAEGGHAEHEANDKLYEADDDVKQTLAQDPLGASQTGSVGLNDCAQLILSCRRQRSEQCRERTSTMPRAPVPKKTGFDNPGLNQSR